MKRIMKRLFLCLFLLYGISGFSVLWGQKKVSVLGDSYSTFGGFMSPSTNLCWYNGPDGGTEKKNNVKRVEQTWWHLLITQMGYQLERNNSYSGSTICCTGYRKDDFSDRAFITRICNLGNPDIILVFGGTNDSWAKSPIGEYQYENWTKQSLFYFRPAFAYLLHHLQELYPDAKVYNLINSGLSQAVVSSMQTICHHYGIQSIQLYQIDKQLGHPSVQGMKSISEQVMAAIGKDEP